MTTDKFPQPIPAVHTFPEPFQSFPTTHPKTDIEDWTPTTLDTPDTTADKVESIFRDAAVGAARQIVAIANGDFQYDYREKGAIQAAKLQMEASVFIIDQIQGGASTEKPWQEWARQLIKNPHSIPKEPSAFERESALLDE